MKFYCTICGYEEDSDEDLNGEQCPECDGFLLSEEDIEYEDE